MNTYDKEKLERAKNKVKEIKGFYTHLTIYLLINAMILLGKLNVFSLDTVSIEFNGWSMLSTPIIWGIGLLFHATYVFSNLLPIFKSWEKRKIEAYMKEEEDNFRNTMR